MARQLARARLLTVDGYGHGELPNPSACANRHVDRYLIDKVLPPEGNQLRANHAAVRRSRTALTGLQADLFGVIPAPVTRRSAN